MKLTNEEKKLQLQGSQLRDMIETAGWKEVLIPHLESVIRNAWVDPRTFKSDEEYAFAMKTAWAMAGRPSRMQVMGMAGMQQKTPPPVPSKWAGIL